MRYVHGVDTIKYNKEKVVVFNTYQMYRSDMLDNLENAIRDAREGGYILGAKLVRGAYMEKERERGETEQKRR